MKLKTTNLPLFLIVTTLLGTILTAGSSVGANNLFTHITPTPVPIAGSAVDLDHNPFIVGEINPNEPYPSHQFTGTEGEVVAIELFDVDHELGEWFDDGCSSLVAYTGVGVEITDNDGFSFHNCSPWGAGNTHHIISFEPPHNAVFTVHIKPNDLQAQGNYFIRLVREDSPHSNNTSFAADPLLSNTWHEDAIEERNTSFSTNAPDVDWFQFSVASDEVPYIIELQHDSFAFRGAGIACNGRENTGLGMIVFLDGELMSDTCQNEYDSGSSTVLELPGTYTVRVTPNDPLAHGTYQVFGGTVLHGLSAEPNNEKWSAAAIPIHTGFDEIQNWFGSTHTLNYATYSGDVDFYKFTPFGDTQYFVVISSITFGCTPEGLSITLEPEFVAYDPCNFMTDNGSLTIPPSPTTFPQEQDVFIRIESESYTPYKVVVYTLDDTATGDDDNTDGNGLNDDDTEPTHVQMVTISTRHITLYSIGTVVALLFVIFILTFTTHRHIRNHTVRITTR